jgi:hypothetical protein
LRVGTSKQRRELFKEALAAHITMRETNNISLPYNSTQTDLEATLI